MGDRYELLVAGEVDHVGALRVLVDSPRRLAVAHEIDRRPLVAPRPPEHGEAGTQHETRAVSGVEVRREAYALATTERLSNVPSELISLDVVEPPDVLS